MNDHARVRGDRMAFAARFGSTVLALGGLLLAQPAAAESPCGCSADYDGNGAVDAADLGIMLGSWSLLDPALDLSGNGFVEASDLGILLGQWGSCGAPANDTCANAISLPSLWNQTIDFCTANAATDAPASAGCMASGTDQIGQDVFYTIVAPTDGVMTLDTCGSNFDTRVAVYKPGIFGTTCPSSGLFSASLLGCNDDGGECFTFFSSYLEVPVEAGTTYTIRLGGYLDDEGLGSLALSFRQPGDACSEAIPVQLTDNGDPDGVSVILSGETFQATPSQNPDPNSCGGANDSKDLWFKVSVDCAVGGANPVSLSASTCLPGTDFDTTLTIYTGICGKLVELECNDDATLSGCQIGGFNRRSFVSIDPDASVDTYWVRLAGYNGATGQYQIRFQFKCLD